MSQPATARRTDFAFFAAIQTRWSDNDMFGHVNNVAYYRFFELAVVEFLTGPCRMRLLQDRVVPFAAESLCRFRRPLSWPSTVAAGLKVEHLGSSSVRYAIALFDESSDEAAAQGHWIHVFVDRETQRPHPVPQAVRAVFERHL
jgi:Predicted thioesterase